MAENLGRVIGAWSDQQDRPGSAVGVLRGGAEMVSAERKIAEMNASDPESMPGCVLTTSTGYQQLSAWVILRNKALDRMMRLASEFGMSPSSRSRVTASKNSSQSHLPGSDDGNQSGWGAI